MRILHVDTELGYRGGQRQIELLLRGLKARGDESILVTPEGSQLGAKARELDIAVEAYRKPMLLGMRSPWLHGWLRTVAKSTRAEIVHAHSGNAHTLAVKALLGRLPVVTTRRVDFPIKSNRWSRQKYTAPGQHFIAISSGVRDVLIAGGVPPARVSIVHSGVDISRAVGGDGTALRREWLGGSSGPVIGFIGALVDHKAPWTLAEAAPLIRCQLPGARIVFVGEGECRLRLEAIAAQHPGSIVLTGWRDDVADCLAAFDMFVMPSKLEGLCTSLVDALAAGVPCVASRAGGIPDVIVDGVTGVLVEPLQAEALAKAVVDLWQDQERRNAYCEAGRAHVAKTFTAQAMVTGTAKVYEDMLRLA